MHKQKNSASVSLSAQQLAELERIFSSKKWPVRNDLGRDEFTDFCSMLECLENNERELILLLTDNFLRIGINDYIRNFIIAFDKMLIDLATVGRKHIIIVPLLCPSDFGSSKSSTMLYYCIKSRLYDLKEKYPHFDLFFLDNPQKLTGLEAAADEKNLVCLVDDYIGTGDSAIGAINYLLSTGIKENNISVLGLVGQSIGIAKIQEVVKRVYVSILRNRGISDLLENADEKISIMLEIERKMKVFPKFSLGYGASQALVKMVRTPNNTFPIYWFTKSKTIPIVPFPR